MTSCQLVERFERQIYSIVECKIELNLFNIFGWASAHQSPWCNGKWCWAHYELGKEWFEFEKTRPTVPYCCTIIALNDNESSAEHRPELVYWLVYIIYNVVSMHNAHTAGWWLLSHIDAPNTHTLNVNMPLIYSDEAVSIYIDNFHWK